MSGLSRSDFEVLDNKKPQPISYFFEEIPSVDVHRDATAPRAPVAALPEPRPQPSATQEPSGFAALFFDDYHMGPANLGQVRDAAKRFVKAKLDSGVRVAIYSASDNVQLGFTRDREKLDRTLSLLQFDLRNKAPSECPPMTDHEAQEVAGSHLPESPVQSQEIVPGPLADGARDSSGQAPAPERDPDPLGVTIAVGKALGCQPEDIKARARFIALQYSRDARTSLAALGGVVLKMAETPGGERTVAVVSEGFLGNDLQQQMNALIDRAVRARVIINTLDAQGLYTPAGFQIQTALQKVDPTGRMSRAYDNLQVDSLNLDQDVLAQTAEGTGGLFIKNNNDFAGGLEKMVAPYTTYVLAFAPAGLKPDGEFHSLAVKVSGSVHATVQARRGYFAPKRSDEVSASAAAGKEAMERALFSEDNFNGLPVQISTKFSKSNPQTARISVTVGTNLRPVLFHKESGRNSDDLTLMIALFDRDGNYIAGDSQTVKLRLSDSELKQAMASGGEITSNLDVKPGSYVIRAVLRESTLQQLGAATGSIQIP